MKPPGPLEPNHRILVIDDTQAIHEDLRKIPLGEVKSQEHLQDDEAFLFGVEAVPVTKSRSGRPLARLFPGPQVSDGRRSPSRRFLWDLFPG
jgi:hypothetical protein